MSGKTHFTPGELDNRILIVAPIGNDAAVTRQLLVQAGIHAQVCCATPEDLLVQMDRGCAGLILAEEVLTPHPVRLLTAWLSAQPHWSDVPVLIITARGETTEVAQRKLSLFEPSGNVTLLERPFRPLTLINAAKVAIRARLRQYQVRDLLLERERILASLERSIERRTAELRETNAQLEELVYSIAHDLRAPLRAMHGFSSLLLQECADHLPAESRDLAERIIRSAESMDAITLGLLAYGRMARLELEIGPVPVEAVWTAALSQCEKAMEDSQAVVETIRPLPSVLAQPAILTQVLANLLGNALKFMAPGVQPRITFRAEQLSGEVRLWMEDNGIGIPAQYHDRIFRVFERLHGVDYQGTGIGLSIVRKGVERMGGKVGLESQSGRGSRFWVQLKAAPAQSAGPHLPPRILSAPALSTVAS